MNRILPLVLGYLAQFADCAGRHLERDLLRMDPVPVSRTGEIRHAGMIGGNQFILVSGEPDNGESRTLVRVSADANEHSRALAARETACRGEELIAGPTRWWYSRCSGNGVQFVSSETTGSPSFVSENDPALQPREWLPFEQDDPGGVLLSVERDGRSVIASRVTPAGVQEVLGRFDRGSTFWGADRGQAVRLGADSVALITIETASEDPVHSSIVLRLLQDGEISTSRVAFHASAWRSVAAVAGPTGQLAIVGAPYDESGVVAIMVDPARPGHPTIRPLMQRAEAVTTNVRLIANGNRFVAGWILQDGQVQIAEFDERMALPAVTVANDAARRAPVISLGHAASNGVRDVTVFWPGDTGQVMLRRLPDPPTGSLIASNLLRALFDWADIQVRQSKAPPS